MSDTPADGGACDPKRSLTVLLDRDENCLLQRINFVWIQTGTGTRGRYDHEFRYMRVSYEWSRLCTCVCVQCKEKSTLRPENVISRICYMYRKKKEIIVSVPEGNSRRPLTPGKPYRKVLYKSRHRSRGFYTRLYGTLYPSTFYQTVLLHQYCTYSAAAILQDMPHVIKHATHADTYSASN